MSNELDKVLAAYGDAWIETDHSQRLALLKVCWSDNGSYMDPISSVQGRKELADHIGRFHVQQPDARIELTSRASLHHARIYFSWKMVTNDRKIVTEGVDFGTLSEDGRIQEIVGFFGPPPALKTAQ